MRSRLSLSRALLGVLLISAFASGPREARARLDAGPLRAGAAIVDITPDRLPVLVNGGFLEASTDRVLDPLHARALVLDDGALRLAIVVVDSCMLPVDLCDRAKALASSECGIRPDRMLIAATHTHSAPSAMDYCLGCRGDPAYMEALPPLLARAVSEATKSLEPAELGSTVIPAPEHTNCRRWILRPDRVRVDPFGERTVRANMHPGHEPPDFIGPAGPIDPALSLLNVRRRDGRPLALLANYSMHYFGIGGGLSADYYGRYAREMARRLGGAPDDGEPRAIVAMMSQGTSGDLHWMDYSRPRRAVDIDTYARELADISTTALREVSYASNVTLAMSERRLELSRRLPDAARLEWARRTWPDTTRRPRNQPEVYAEQALYFETSPTDIVPLQALRIGDLGIAAIPCEVYGITGLKVKARSPLEKTLNMELANGASGYIPPREQHALGGYTTWPARSAGLEVGAESRIVDTVLELLEEVTGAPRRDPRVAVSMSAGAHVEAVLRARPRAYWRLEELEGPLLDEISRHELSSRGPVAYHLPGPATSAFSRDGRNAAIHLAGGHLETSLTLDGDEFSIELWFWSGLPFDAREVTAELVRIGSLRLALSGSASESPGRLMLGPLVGRTVVGLRSWHHLVLSRRGERITVHLDGDARPEIDGELSAEIPRDVTLRLGGSDAPDATLEGKLDEVAVFHRALTTVEIAEHWAIAALPPPVSPRSAGVRSRPSSPQQLAAYESAVLVSKPAAFWTLHGESDDRAPDRSGHGRDARLETGAHERLPSDSRANFAGGRLRAVVSSLESDHSVELWFRNDTPNHARPVTGYLFSRGADAARGAPGDHLGIGGTHSNAGRLFVYNGDARQEIVAGETFIEPGGWNHVVLVRTGEEIRIHLNGREEPDARGVLVPTFPRGEDAQLFVGARNEGFAPFAGIIEHVSIHDRALSPAEIHAHFLAAGMPAPSPEAVRADPARLESPPLSPAASLRGIHVRDGFEVELVVAEPLVRDPVAIDFGPDGRLWVAEMADYPYGMDGEGQPGGRVRFLEDVDGDGRFDRSVVFVEPLSFPTGVMGWRDGVLITAAPDILFAADRDGDGRASGDEVRVLYTGFLPGNQQLRVNGPTWGLDNWVHLASGGHHAGYGASNPVRLLARDETLRLGSRDLRIQPDLGLLEPLSGPSQFGRVRDDWGQWFGVQNSHPLWHYVLEDHASTRNPHVAAPDAREQLRVPSNPPVFPNKAPQKRFHSHGETGRFTSACGISIYRDEALFERSDVTHAFTCEPFHNVVQHSELRERGVSFTAGRSSTDGARDFFAAADRWCRPVMTRTGPDGALWIVDMYRYMIEHPDWLPPAGREELKPFYRAGEDRGRIYRVVRSGALASPDAGQRVPRLAALSSTELVERLASPNGSVRDLAHRLLVERRSAGSGVEDLDARLETMALGHTEPLARLHALACLDGREALSNHALRRSLLEESHPGVLRHALRLAEPRVAMDEELRLACLALVQSPHPVVVLQLAKSLGAWTDPRAGEALGELARGHAEDPWIRKAIAGSALHHATAIAMDLVALETPGASELLAQALDTAVARGEHSSLASVLDRAMALPGDSGLRRGFVVATRLLDRLETRESHQLPVPADELRERLDETLDLALRVAFDRARAESLRRLAIELVAHATDARDVLRLERCLEPSESSAVQRAAVEALGRHGSPEATALLLEHWKRFLPELRDRVATGLVARADGARRLLDRVASGEIPPGTIAASERQSLLRHPAADVAKRAGELLAGPPSVDREAVLDRFRESLERVGDRERGEPIFRERCGRCHSTVDGRAPIGPDLRALSDRSAASLLDSIIVPGRIVEPKFLGYTVVLASGEIVQGLVTGETGNSLLVRLADGEERAILRESIRHLESTGVSFMPEGLEADLELQAMADLLAHVAALGTRE